MKWQPCQRNCGFTLIEVIVAMFVIALGVGALLTTLTTSSNSVGHLRDKSFAEWIALNRITEVRLMASPPGPGVSTGEVEYAGAKWRWRQEIIDQDTAGMLRIDVSVARATDKPAATKDGEEEVFPALVKAYGFLGTETGAPNGIDPDLEPAATSTTWNAMKQQRGFTLVEIMIAVLIAAILAVMAFESMQQSLKSRDRIRTHQARLQALQFTMRSLVQDLTQIYPRPVREPLGPGYQAAVVGVNELTFTRGGWSNPVGLERSTLQRVRYALREGKLYRDYWMVLDAQLYPAPVSRQLLDEVLKFKVRYMNDGRNWQDNWPPASQQGGTPTMRELGWRPIAIEITLELKDYGVLTRLIEVAG